MDTSKMIMATIVGAFTSFIAGFLIYGLALHMYFAENTSGMLEEPNFVWLIVGHLSFSFLTTYIFMKWAGIKSLATGASAGVIIGILFTLGHVSFALGTSEMYNSITPAFVDTVAGAVVWMFGGAGVGWWLGRGETKE